MRRVGVDKFIAAIGDLEFEATTPHKLAHNSLRRIQRLGAPIGVQVFFDASFNFRLQNREVLAGFYNFSLRANDFTVDFDPDGGEERHRELVLSGGLNRTFQDAERIEFEQALRLYPKYRTKRRWQVFLADNLTCVECGQIAEFAARWSAGRAVHMDAGYIDENGNTDILTIDHILPTSKGGHRSSLLNLQTMCRKCNETKGDTISGNQGLLADATLENSDLLTL
jgi:hypothetical protein